MDKFVIREARIGADIPQANQIFSSNNLLGINKNNNMITQESMYLGGYGREYPLQQVGAPAYIMHQQMSPSNFTMQSPNANFYPVQTQMTSGIDPRYLAGYSSGSVANFITTGQVQPERSNVPHNFGSDYENRVFVAPDRSIPKPFVAKVTLPLTCKGSEINKKDTPKLMMDFNQNVMNPVNKMNSPGFLPRLPSVTNKSSEENVSKEESLNKTLTRSDKLKALHKAGPRAFSGPVEMVLKWHKTLQEIGILVIYEIVGKCVSVRPGESCAKNLVVRDDSGPAMQVVYYEIDFLLPELKPPCTVRVIGRMMAGTCRLQAFSVRPATGDDVAALPRRAAVAAHHVGRICKEYGIGS